MSKIPDNEARRPVPEIERHMLRARLFQELRGAAFYTNAMRRDLPPLWTAAKPEAEPSSEMREWVDLRSRARPSADRPALRAYVAAVEAFTVNRLRLTWQGQPTRWAPRFVHAYVEPWFGGGVMDDGQPLGDPGPEPGEAPPDGTSSFGAVFGYLHITVNPAGALLEDGEKPMLIPGRDGRLPDVPPEWQPRAENIPAKEFMQFREWKELETQAAAMARAIVRDMRAEYTSWYRYQQDETPKRLEANTATFAAHIINRSDPLPDTAERKALERLAARLGCDVPWTQPRQKQG